VIRPIIRAVRDRREFIDYLTRALPTAEWCFDEKRDAMDTFLRALDMAGDGPALHMEDDVVLCEHFLARAAWAVMQRPNTVIQFFSMRKADLDIGSRLDRNFMMTQCFYLPAGYSAALRAYHPDWPARHEHPTGFDIMIGDWLRLRREPYWVNVPNLVDHRVGPSLINPRRSSRRVSKTFQGGA
jgi:hypothetical protein